MTKLSKNLLATAYVPVDGTDPMTGNLEIIKTNPLLKITNSGAGTTEGIWMTDANAFASMDLKRLSNRICEWSSYDATGVKQASAYLEINGNLSVSALTPSADDQLTRRDYVDTNFVDLRETAAQTMSGNLNFGDNDHVIFGAGTDLDIYSNGSNSLLKYISGSIFFESASATTVAAFTQSAVKLYFESSQKLETVTGGINVTGTLNTSNTLTVDNTTPQIKLRESDAAADEKYWRFYAAGGQLIFDIHNDANTVTDQIFTVDRTANSIDSLTMQSTIDLLGYSEKANSIPTTGAVTLNATLGTYFYNTATTGIITFTFSGAAATGRVTTMTLELFGGGTNAPVWPASVDWPSGTEPTWSTGVDVVSFITRNNGTTWLGMLGGTAFA